ncbi:MAG: hypothetical protein Q7S95_02940 [bacterium]|nr:hypothetical protein [bacterium]
MEENQIVVSDAEAVVDVAAEPVERPSVEGVVVAIVRQHVVTIRVDIDGKPVEASFFIEDISRDNERASIKNGARIVSARSCAPERAPAQVMVPHLIIERIRARLRD